MQWFAHIVREYRAIKCFSALIVKIGLGLTKYRISYKSTGRILMDASLQ